MNINTSIKNGFIKRAQEYGLTEDEAIAVYDKYAQEVLPAAPEPHRDEKYVQHGARAGALGGAVLGGIGHGVGGSVLGGSKGALIRGLVGAGVGATSGGLTGAVGSAILNHTHKK